MCDIFVLSDTKLDDDDLFNDSVNSYKWLLRREEKIEMQKGEASWSSIDLTYQ